MTSGMGCFGSPKKTGRPHERGCAARARVPARAHGATEHAIVPHAMGQKSRVIPVSPDGLIDEAALDAVLAYGPALIAIQHVNNETGVIQPLERLVDKIRSSGSLL